MILSKAKAIAEDLKGQLLPFCSTIDIAGSIRREKQEVKDIELLAIASNRNQLALYLYEHFGVGCRKDARYIKFDYKGIKVDLFLPQPHDYGRMLAIRTGPAEYSHNVLAIGWIKRGYEGSERGLVLKGCPSDGSRVEPGGPFEPKVFPTEESFFSFIGVPWIEPRLRN